MKNIGITFLVFYCVLGQLYSQTDPSIREQLPSEKVYLHTNTTMAFAGEYLYYKFYTLLQDEGTLSPISKIGYVDLLNEAGEVVFHHKLRLEKGRAASELFLPADLPSGNYQWVGYTRWMRNLGPESFFKADLTLLNPYRGDQGVFLRPEGDVKPDRTASVTSQVGEAVVSLKLDKRTYGKRQEVSLSLQSLSKMALQGTFSLSVRKKEILPGPGRRTFVDFAKEKPGFQKKTERVFLPETRGDFISGTLTQGAAIKNLVIFIPGENDVFKIVTPEQDGTFGMQLPRSGSGSEIYLTPTGNPINTPQIVLENDSITDYGELEFFQFRLEESMKEEVLERSIQNQIENAYFQIRPDTVLQAEMVNPFYGGQITTYILDDYTRFPTLRETFVEILEHVWIEEGKGGEVSFKVRPFLPLQDSGRKPLVLLDGAFIGNHANLLTFPSNAIDQIRIGRDQYLYGSLAFQGIIQIETREGDAYTNDLDRATQRFPYAPPRLQKKYFKENYRGGLIEEKKHLPDFRRQLAWFPEIRMESPEQTIRFFSSDLTGEFEIVLEGITTSGIPVSNKVSFEVE